MNKRIQMDEIENQMNAAGANSNFFFIHPDDRDDQ